MGLWHPDTIDGMVAHQIAACDRCEADRRPRMLVCDYHEGWIAALDGTPDLPVVPVGTSIRLEFTADGWTVRGALMEFNWRERTADELRGNWWVDPEGGAA